VSPGGYLRLVEIGRSGGSGKHTATAQAKNKREGFSPPFCTLYASFRVDADDFGFFPQPCRGIRCRCRAVGRVNLASLYVMNAARITGGV
jgi:hypothetical protein